MRYIRIYSINIIGFIISFISFFLKIENCPFFLCRQLIVCRVKQAKKEGGAGIRLEAMPSFSVPRRAGPFLFPGKKHRKFNCTYSYRSTFWSVSDRLKGCFIWAPD